MKWNLRVHTEATGIQCPYAGTECNILDRLCGLVVRVLQTRRLGFDSRHYRIFWKEKKRRRKQVVGLERGPLSLVSTTEELLDRKVAAPV
jgi:hypothetical protein